MNETRTKPTPDQERAAHAWKVVEGLKADKDEVKREFGTQVRKLPTRILTAGLGPALAFLEAKGYAPRLRDALADWMAHKRPPQGPAAEKRLVVRIIHGDADFLRFATAECLAYLQWLVRFTEAEGLSSPTE
jgi:CRISPR-associated protein Cmr5